MQTRPPLAIIIRDGWGNNPHPEQNQSNAVYLARKPVDDRIRLEYPTTLIATSGFDVGLPEATMGNSEVGHQNIGAGRIVDQESVHITKLARTDQFVNNSVLLEAVDRAKSNGRSLHLMGIASDAGVHGLLEHLYALLRLAKARGVDRVFVHAFTDGRDTPPTSGLSYITQIEQKMREIGVGRIASVSGRYWAMDRDNRWPRIERAYRVLTDGSGPPVKSASEAIKHYYEHPVESNLSGDEFITPSVVVDSNRNPVATIKTGDSVIFYNYRGDRPRELTKAFVNDPFSGFERKKLDLYFVTMTAYEEGLPVHVAFPKPEKMKNILGDYLSQLGLKQFRCAETEKFPHVTFFFNDYREQPFAGEDRLLCPSRKDVATYDLVPEMSAGAITDETIKAIESKKYNLLVINYANGDMVGHTGNLSATIKAIEATDQSVGRLLDALAKVNGAAIVLADHGNAEMMIDPSTGAPYTAHTTFPVELIVVDDRFKGRKLRDDGRLADVAPTALAMMGLSIPTEMTGRNLIL